MAVMVCSSHQANLVAKTATIGAGARVGTGRSDEGMRVARNTCGVVVRLFKYLLADYCDPKNETVAARPGEARPGYSSDGFQVLYTKSVLPDKVLDILNNGFDLEHVVAIAGEANLAEARASAVDKLSELIMKFVLHVDEHPVQPLANGLSSICLSQCLRWVVTLPRYDSRRH